MKNSKNKAFALEYKAIDQLPKVVARGTGELAQAIIDLATFNNIPVCEYADLAKVLDQTSTDSNIDEPSFKLVAEVIAFLYHVETGWRDQHEFLDPVLSTK